MKKIPWKNVTKKHPRGVCEAATSIWLQKIAAVGIKKANKIVPEDCDDLQAKCETGTYTWAVDLLPALQDSKPTATFNAFDGSVVKTVPEILAVLNAMNDNDFRYISSINANGSGHATALFKYQGNIYFFDPNHAIYIIGSAQADKDALALQIKTNLTPWSDNAVRSGQL